VVEGEGTPQVAFFVSGVVVGEGKGEGGRG